jgi:NarL family two-component system response regulator LiaR
MLAQLPIHILIVDDQEMVRSGLEMGLATFDELQVVGSAGSSQEAVRLCCELRPQVILMDMMLAGKPDGILAARTIHEIMPDVRIIALSGFSSFDLVEAAFRAGITSYLFKNVSIDELVTAIRSTWEGKTIISPEITQDLNHSPLSPLP